LSFPTQAMTVMAAAAGHLQLAQVSNNRAARFMPFFKVIAERV